VETTVFTEIAAAAWQTRQAEKTSHLEAVRLDLEAEARRHLTASLEYWGVPADVIERIAWTPSQKVKDSRFPLLAVVDGEIFCLGRQPYTSATRSATRVFHRSACADCEAAIWREVNDLASVGEAIEVRSRRVEFCPACEAKMEPAKPREATVAERLEEIIREIASECAGGQS
jgi:hypothetical protein